VHIRPARLTAVSVLVAAVLSTAALTFATPASAAAPCWKQILNEWTDSQSGQIAANYPLHCYREAIAHVPNDLRQYSSVEEDILAARQQAARGPLRTTQIHNPASDEAANGPSNDIYHQAVDSLSPNNADSMPLPLLILAGLSLILIATGGAGLVTRRVKARRVPPA
jgi:hypothetical protein